MINKSQPPVGALEQFFSQPIFNLAFRLAFLLAATSTVIAIGLWLAFLNGWILMSNSALSPMVWHLHEMFFGFGAMVATGFVLTAVQTWTGVPSIKGRALMFVVLLWLVARVCFLLNSTDLIWIGVTAQTLWWLSIIFVYSRIVLSVKNQRNYIFIPLFSMMMVLNLAIILLDQNGMSFWAQHIGRTSIFLFILLISVVGGRVIPFFTKVRIKLDPKPTANWIEQGQLVGGIAVAICYGTSMHLPIEISAFLMMALGSLHLYRQSHWNSTKTLVEPLLWTLHLSYGLMAVGLILMGASLLIPQLMFSAVLHVVTIGAIGLMILSMMSRVSLGHTGRAIKCPAPIKVALYLMIASMLARVILAWVGMPREAWLLSGGLWITAFVLFVVTYLPILSKPRVESSPFN